MSQETLVKIDRVLALALRWGSIVCLIGLIIFVAAGVIVRFVPVFSMGWADEIVEFGFAWMVFLGAAALWRGRSHFRVDLLPLRLASTRGGPILGIILSLLALIFFLVFTYQGSVLSIKATDRSPILELPRYLWYGVIPLSGMVIIGYTIRDLWSFFRGRS
jgi:TRAP-type C4-dicarboxylate transport system permease small subunit